MNALKNRFGQSLAQQKAQLRQQYGTDVTPAQCLLAGRPLRMKARSLEKREQEYLPSGTSNVADADLRVFEASPADFQTVAGPVWPAVGSQLLWHGTRYTVLAVRPGDDEVDGVIATVLLYAYKTPVAAVSADDAEQARQWPAPPL